MTPGPAGQSPFRVLRLVVVGACAVLAARVVQIQVLEHDHYSRIAEGTWGKEIPLYPERGQIYDRNGKPLALSVTTWRIGVSCSRVDDPQRTAKLLAPILQTDPGQLAARLRAAGGKHLVLGSDVSLTRDQKLRLQNESAVTLEDQRARIYPYDGVGASLIGFYRYGKKDEIATGLEFSLAENLAGRNGLAREIKTPLKERNLGQVVLQEPVHGRHQVLSLDIELQAICERQLGLAVERYGAVGGSVLILEPATGDILAAASWPLLPTREHAQAEAGVWNNRNFTNQYEPGSVFKIFTTAALLRYGAIDTATVFDCSNPDFGRFHIDNEGKHRYGPLPLMRAFAKSSNIYFARAACSLSDQQLYGALTDFGFGQPTALPYRGQVKGILREPARWSQRSKPTMAIGQEIAVTPLQLGMAMCAVANGGTLLAPRLVREVRDPQGGPVQVTEPMPLRRIMAEPLAEVLREAMARVVKEGTGVGGRLEWIATGGKTGTAQKSRDGKGFTPGAYMASFAGLAPVDKPRLVILTIVDEPRGIHHFAAQSAVPLFRDIVCEIRRCTDWLTDVPGERTTACPVAPEAVLAEVPDVLFLSVPNAVQRLSAAGFQIEGDERDGLVIQQVPAAGTRCPAGGTVSLVVGAGVVADAAAAASAEALCPDFTGLSDRQVRGLAARLGIPVRLRGSGYAVRQTLSPGEPLRGRPVMVGMEGPWR